MSGILAATATFKPSESMARWVDLYVQVRLFAAAQKAQGVVVVEAQATCPVVTGDLQSKIQPGEIIIGGGRIVAPVVSDSDHAPFVEFGTGLRGAGTYPYALPQEGVPFTGSWVYDFRNQGWVGMPSQPYLRPALDTARDQVLQEFKSA
jgi:hypothetical protein